MCIFPALVTAQNIPGWKVDPSWPKPLPHNWMAGHFEKVVVDKDDNIWVAHYSGSMDRRSDHAPMGLAQTPPIAECCVPAPEVIEFDPQGNVVRAWGGRGYTPEWPEAVHGFWVDRNMNVWVSGNHAPDRNLLKFTADGKLLLEIGHVDGPIGEYRSNRGELTTANNQATDLLGGASGIFVDEQANEVYVADGYINRRVVVFDSNTGKFKRGWGAYGIPLSDIDNNCTANDCIAWRARTGKENDNKQFVGTLEMVRISNDGLVYVVDRDGRRIQVFTKEGRFVQEIFTGQDTGIPFVPYTFTFSHDPGQKYLIVADGHNGCVKVLNRKDGSEVTRFGSRGKNAGQFGELTSVDLDSKGNLYTTETKYHCRLQKFVPEDSVTTTPVSSSFYPAQAATQEVPRFKVDAAWPQTLPFKWILGMINGLGVSPDDHVWILHEPRGLPNDEIGAALNPPTSDCCIPAPEVLEFDPNGKVLKAWSGRERISTWPVAAHGISVDKKGNVWIAGVGKPWHPDLPGFTMGNPLKVDTEARDRQVLKFTATGKLLLQIGQPSLAPENNKDTSILGAPTAMAFDDAANEAYIADGLMNKRVVVYDMNTGEFKRGWGAYGIPLSEIDNSDPAAKELPTGRVRDASVSPPKQFRTVTGIAISDDGLVYVTDQMNNRIQAFTKQGKFVKEMSVAPKTGGNGSAWGLAVSRDPKQSFLFVADGESGVIRILDRQGGTDLGTLGSKGRNAGQFSNPAFVAFDSQGDLYTGEVNFSRSWDGRQATYSGIPETPGGRLQKFVPGK
jgi:DNA-binding beta-propeller fold protein YncE